MSAKPIGKLTAAEIAARLDELSPAAIAPVDDDAKTKREWAALWSCSIHRANARLRRGMDNGMVEVVTRPRKQVDGRIQTRPCYRFINK